MTTTTGTPAAMDLSFDGQRRYCERLGLIPALDGVKVSARIAAWYDNPACQEVSRLLGEMETHQRTMTTNASWMRQHLTENAARFDGAEVRTTGLYDSAGMLRFAAAYDMALAAYVALEKHLQGVVNDIRRAQGYEIDAFSRLENHPTMTPAEDQAVRALAKLERHLTEQKAYSEGGQRRHLREVHGMKVSPRTGPAPAMLHENAHADDLAALRAQVAAITPKEATV